MKHKITPIKKLRGEVTIPGDKSISHRGIILGSISKGDTYLNHFLMGSDCLNTLKAFQQMGIQFDFLNQNTIVVHGKGIRGLESPNSLIEAGNSGTTARLLIGLLSGQSFNSVITGDASLQKRPMDRIVHPLKQMGALLNGKDNGHYLPISIEGTTLNNIDYILPVASAQVKSSIILAALYGDMPSTIYEPSPSRNHTEIMLSAFGGKISRRENMINVYPTKELYGQALEIPGDISSGAFILTAALLIPNSRLTLRRVGINPTRTGILEVYKNMGAEIAIENIVTSCGEEMGDLTVNTSQLKGVTIQGSLIPRLIDEIPIIALAATQAYGTTTIRDAGELKIKESDRIQAVVQTLSSFGANIEATEDGMVIHGPTPLTGNTIETHMDHRIAMTAVIAGLIAKGDTTILGSEWIDISFPSFLETIKRLSS